MSKGRKADRYAWWLDAIMSAPEMMPIDWTSTRCQIPDWLVIQISDFKGIWLPGASSPEMGCPSWQPLPPFGYQGYWQTVCELFAAHKLDRDNPRHWQELFLKFAHEHAARRPGREKVWTEDRLCQLAVDFELTKRANPHIKSQEKICELLVNGKGKFQVVTYLQQLNQQFFITRCRQNRPKSKTEKPERAIRRPLYEANKRLDELVKVLVQRVRDDFDPWTADHEAKVRNWVVDKLTVSGPPASLFAYLDDLRSHLRR
jgi:hypothetical protein